MNRIDWIFNALIDMQGSDIHLASGAPPYIRKNGDLVALDRPAIGPDEMEAMLFELLDEEGQKTFRKNLEMDFSHQFGKVARFRGNIFMKQTGIAAVFRIIPSRIQSLEDLNCPPAIHRLSKLKQGLILVTGPTGSGKSTTLAAMIDNINRNRHGHILTIEDPVEFVHMPFKSRITHREIGADVPDFATAIRSAVREDPDVILVGELRGIETMQQAIAAASFGILVMATVHTNSVAETVDRIVNSFPANQQGQVRGMLAESLAGIITQQLLRTADGRTRVAAHEILVSTSAIANLIREGKTYQIPSMIQTGIQLGMQTMDMALEKHARENRITKELAYERAADRDNMAKVLGYIPPAHAQEATA
ncbi:MAG: Twitching mobility protein [Myxococcota bacterium]|nr:Twitching mobility protein [Myxococcota bacterium]